MSAAVDNLSGMGFDTSYHPVDLALVEDRLLPYIAGAGADSDLADLVARAVEIRKTRFVAKQWALGALSAATSLGITALDSQLHVWGRPFFIVADTTDRVVEDTLRYLATPPDGVEALAHEMLARLDPALAGKVEPSTTGHLPDDAALAHELMWRMRLLRASGAALRAGEATVSDPDSGRTHHPGRLMDREVPFSVLEFAATLHPGWMSRGYTWPTRLYAEAGLDAAEFTAPEPLFAALRDAYPGRDWFSAPTIDENYMVGGFVDAAQVQAARARLTENRDALLRPATAEGWADSCAVDLTKIEETLAFAAHLGFAFCEATEIYSGFGGVMN